MRTEAHRWETGHRPHISGAGKHDTRPNRQRTRANAKRAAIKEF